MPASSSAHPVGLVSFGSILYEMKHLDNAGESEARIGQADSSLMGRSTTFPWTKRPRSARPFW